MPIQCLGNATKNVTPESEKLLGNLGNTGMRNVKYLILEYCMAGTFSGLSLHVNSI